MKTFELEVNHIEYWYDRRTRSWVIQRMDKQRNQIGEAIYVGTKECMMHELELLKDLSVPQFKASDLEDIGANDYEDPKLYHQQNKPLKK